jgi:nitrate/nitrite transporter NarK
LPYIFAVISMYLVGRSSDRMLERRWHYAGAMSAAGVSLALLGMGANSVLLTVVLLTIGACGAWSALTVFWTIPPAYLTGTAKAGGIAFISSVGALGGFVSPTIVGWVTTQTGSVYYGLAVIGGMLVLSAAILLIGIRPKLLHETAAVAAAS